MKPAPLSPRARLTRTATRLAGGLALSLLLPGVVLAGGKAIMEATGKRQGETMDVEMTITWSAQHTRMDLSSQPGTYMILRDNKSYTVTNQGGRVMVFNMAQLGQMAPGGGGGQKDTAMGPDSVASLESMEPTGSTETVAGIEGEVYRVKWTDTRGKSHDDMAVLSDEAVVVGLMEAFQRYVDGVGTGASDPLSQAVVDRGMGMLRFGDRMEVTSIEAMEPPATTFELPAEPMDLNKMMQRGR
jgi:hypothetical protein